MLDYQTPKRSKCVFTHDQTNNEQTHILPDTQLKADSPADSDDVNVLSDLSCTSFTPGDMTDVRKDDRNIPSDVEHLSRLSDMSWRTDSCA